MEKNDKIDQTVDRIRDLASRGGDHEALRLAEELCREFPDDEECAYERLCIIVHHYMPQDGLEAGKEFVKRFPSSFYGHLLLASANIRLKRGQAALDELDAAATLGAPESMILTKRVNALRLVGNKEDVLSLIGSRTDLGSLRAKFELQQPNDVSGLDGALDELEGSGETLQNLAVYRSKWLASRHMYDEAENCLHRAISENGPSAVLVHTLSYIEFKNGKRDSACARLEEFLAGHPENIFIRRSISWYYFWSGQFIPGARHLWLLLRYGVFGDPNKRK